MIIEDVIPVKPDIDPREFLHTTLDNGMRILLISDPGSETAAGCVAVGAGSFDDPEDLPGLAHFCEHMLFFGSERFPGEDAFKEFVDSHGGRSNAFTTEDHTAYQFQVSAPAFLDAVDRFGAFFSAPLFPEDGTAREVKAIQSEFELYMQDDSWRALHLLKHFADESHPLHRFTIGSTSTLRVPAGATPMHTRVREWWEKHYHAQAMTAVFCGPSPLGVMKAAVVAAFSSLPRGTRAPLRECLLDLLGGKDPMASIRARAGPWRDGAATLALDPLAPMTAGKGADAAGTPHYTASPTHSPLDAPFSPLMDVPDPRHPHAPRLWCEYLPVADEPSVSIYWPIPTEMTGKVSHSGIAHVLSVIIGHEGAGSVLEALKARDLASGLCAGETTAGLFSVAVDLTESGQKEVGHVVAVVFAFISELFATVGLPDPADKRLGPGFGVHLEAPEVPRNESLFRRFSELWKEQSVLREILFRFDEPPEPWESVLGFRPT